MELTCINDTLRGGEPVYVHVDIIENNHSNIQLSVFYNSRLWLPRDTLNESIIPSNRKLFSWQSFKASIRDALKPSALLASTHQYEFHVDEDDSDALQMVIKEGTKGQVFALLLKVDLQAASSMGEYNESMLAILSGSYASISSERRRVQELEKQLADSRLQIKQLSEALNRHSADRDAILDEHYQKEMLLVNEKKREIQRLLQEQPKSRTAATPQAGEDDVVAINKPKAATGSGRIAAAAGPAQSARGKRKAPIQEIDRDDAPGLRDAAKESDDYTALAPPPAVLQPRALELLDAADLSQHLARIPVEAAVSRSQSMVAGVHTVGVSAASSSNSAIASASSSPRATLLGDLGCTVSGNGNAMEGDSHRETSGSAPVSTHLMASNSTTITGESTMPAAIAPLPAAIFEPSGLATNSTGHSSESWPSTSALTDTATTTKPANPTAQKKKPRLKLLDSDSD